MFAKSCNLRPEMYVQAAMAVMVVETPILGKTNVGTGIYTTNNVNTGLTTPQTKLLKIFWCGGGDYIIRVSTH